MGGTAHRVTAARGRFAHEVVLYEGADDHTRAVLPFVDEGLAHNEPVLVALLPHLISRLRTALGPRAELVTFVDMAELGENPARIIPAWRDFLRDHRGAGPVRGVGEPVWAGRRSAELAEAQLHEGLLNLAFDGGPGWQLLCPYDVSALPADVIGEALRTHPLHGDGRPCSDYAGHDHAQRTFATELPEPPADATRITFGAGELGTLRSVVRRVVAASRVSADRGDDLVLAAHELAMNSVQHGGGRGELLTWVEPGTLVVEVRDTGRIADPLIGRTMPDFGSLSGRGIWMANQLCSLVQVRSGDDGTQVRLHSWL